MTTQNAKDSRHMSIKEQLIQRINVLYDLLDTTNTHDIATLHNSRLKRGVLKAISIKHHVSPEKVYRWIREYDLNNGIHIQMRGRVKHAA